MQKTGKNKPVIWTNQAKSDLEKIFNHIAVNFSLPLAIKKTYEIIKEVEGLSLFPRKGSISERFNEIREIIIDSNTIYYRNNESDIVIASIRARKTVQKKKV